MAVVKALGRFDPHKTLELGSVPMLGIELVIESRLL